MSNERELFLRQAFTYASTNESSIGKIFYVNFFFVLNLLSLYVTSFRPRFEKMKNFKFKIENTLSQQYHTSSINVSIIRE